MPDYAGLLYWYGYTTGNLQAVTSTNGWSNNASVTIVAPTFNTNNISINISSNVLTAVAGLVAPTSGKKLKVISTVNVNSGGGVRIYGTTGNNKTVSLTDLLYDNRTASTNPTLWEYTYSASNYYYIIGANGAADRGGNIYALWYE